MKLLLLQTAKPEFERTITVPKDGQNNSDDDVNEFAKDLLDDALLRVNVISRRHRRGLRGQKGTIRDRRATATTHALVVGRRGADGAIRGGSSGGGVLAQNSSGTAPLHSGDSRRPRQHVVGSGRRQVFYGVATKCGNLSVNGKELGGSVDLVHGGGDAASGSVTIDSPTRFVAIFLDIGQYPLF
jgi:hypothetical protein